MTEFPVPLMPATLLQAALMSLPDAMMAMHVPLIAAIIQDVFSRLRSAMMEIHVRMILACLSRGACTLRFPDAAISATLLSAMITMPALRTDAILRLVVPPLPLFAMTVMLAPPTAASLQQ